ncbi:MAG: hemerythrin domain-containing protein [Acidobacteriia bacterium]|nr:hemerythrin domain-containing protein [Terriglobia bacterium]
MNAIESLKDDHRLIEQGLLALERMCTALEAGQAINSNSLEKWIEFIQIFADRYHHLNEERILFERLSERGMPRLGGALEVLESEHEESRMLIRAIADTVPWVHRRDPAALERFLLQSRNYVQLLRSHIQTEEDDVFPQTDSYLTAADHAEISNAFDQAVDNGIVAFRKEWENTLHGIVFKLNH